MLLQIDTKESETSEDELRTAAKLLTNLADLRYGTMESRMTTPTSQTLGTVLTAETRVPPPPADGLPPADSLKGAPLPPLDSEPSNVLPFVPPPPPLSGATAKSVISSLPSSSAQPTLTQPSPSEPLIYDASGLPWDGRIHQKKQSKKKDGTWKLQKGIDQSVVTAVVSELAAKRLPAAVTQNFAPPTGSGRVPAPPQNVEVTTSRLNGQVVPPPPVDVPPPPPPLPSEAAPTVASTVVPPPPEFGTGSPAASVQAGVSEFRALLDKITAASQAKQITPQKVNEIVQAAGAPNLMSLKTMPALVLGVMSAIDLAIMGIG